jgi:TolB-like protein
MADIFISYAREDREAVGRLAAQLEAAGLTCWWDKQLAVGDRYLERTEAELNAARAVVVVWTKHSANSHWVADEAGVARETGRLAPISLDGTMPPLGFRQFQFVDFRPWLKGDAAPFDELAATLAGLSVKAEPAKAPAAAPRRLKLRAPMPAVAAFLVLLLALGGWLAWDRFFRQPALEPSIAVLPFENASGDPGKDYLARGVAIEIINTLATLKGVKVISRNSSFSFGFNADPVEVGAKFKVAHVLTGRVSDQNGRLTITADLINARTGVAIRSDTYVVQGQDMRINGVQGFMGSRIAGAMSIAFDVSKPERLNGGGTDSLEAYDFYLRGLDEWWFKFNTPAAIDYYTKATTLDPDYAEAWAGLSIAFASTGFNYADPADARAAENKGFGYAQRGVELAPDSNITQTMYGAVATSQLKWVEGDEALNKAMAISRTELALVNWWFLLQRTGRLAESARVMLQIEEVDPIRGLNAQGVHGYAAQGRYEELKYDLTRRGWFASTELMPQINILQYYINTRGSRDDIRKTLEGIARRPEERPAELARRVLAGFDNPQRARAALRATYADPTLAHATRWELVPYLAAWLGDTDLVLEAWSDELPTNMLRTINIWDPAFADARKHPDFKPLMRKIGLVDYWRAKGWADKCRPLDGDDFECV